jgi:taurine dioxygenase
MALTFHWCGSLKRRRFVVNRTGLEFIPTGGPLGAEVRGLDLAQEQPGDIVFRILKAFAQYQVLIFREQKLDLERQLEIAEWFAPRYVPPADKPLCEHGTAPVSMVSNVMEGGVLGFGELSCHSDLPYLPLPVLGSALYAIEVPPRGGETSWSNLYQAYDALNELTKAGIKDVKVCAINPMVGRIIQRNVSGDNQHYSDYSLPTFPHPLVRTHPETGRESLFVSYASFELIGLEDPERSRHLLQQLQAHVDQDCWYYTHRWQVGDLVIWDNRCTNHKRRAFDPSQRRVMRRVVMAGTIPF